MAGAGLASSDLSQIVAAAHQGRVGDLFVALGVQVWGSFDQQTGAVAVQAEAQAHDEDLLQVASLLTLSNSGRVFAVPPEQVPGGREAAALFRY
jgi:hypothetical protein